LGGVGGEHNKFLQIIDNLELFLNSLTQGGNNRHHLSDPVLLDFLEVPSDFRLHLMELLI